MFGGNQNVEPERLVPISSFDHPSLFGPLTSSRRYGISWCCRSGIALSAGSPSVLSSTPKKSALYFFQNIVFRAENELFQVPDLYFVKGSQFFRDMFELPTPSGQPADGSSEDRPLVLEGIRAAEFLSLLKVMYPQNFGEQERISESEWTSILKLPDMWQMSAFKKFAVESLALLLSEDPITRMALARRYGVEEWLYPSYAELVRRAQPICREDVDAIGIETALKICSLRERCVEETTKTITIYGANQGRLFANIPTTNTVQTLVLNPQRKQVGSDQITDMEQHIRDIFSPERR
ncbi:hypothetical protein CC2G_008600 [Coprinopsis cinerea AmutBmut pab1-1]|nr:hypothetical protein CC2G_008600 [Coprinopsis cinerea AmutBmut pab1-1]